MFLVLGIMDDITLNHLICGPLQCKLNMQVGFDLTNDRLVKNLWCFGARIQSWRCYCKNFEVP